MHSIEKSPKIPHQISHTPTMSTKCTKPTLSTPSLDHFMSHKSDRNPKRHHHSLVQRKQIKPPPLRRLNKTKTTPPLQARTS